MKIGSRVRLDDGRFGVVAGICLRDEDDKPACVHVSIQGGDSWSHRVVENLTEVNPLEEFEEQAKEAELALAVARKAWQEAAEAASAARKALEEAREKTPPFFVGQRVRVGTGKSAGRPVTVAAVERAFGQWMAQVLFSGNDTPYTYPCSGLSA